MREDACLPRFAILYTTVSTEQQACILAHHALEKSYAACANIFPTGLSVYGWKGAIETSAEVYIIFKATLESLPALKEYILAHHPHETPTLLTISMETTRAFYEHVTALAPSCDFNL